MGLYIVASIGKDHQMNQTRLMHILLTLSAVLSAGCGKKASDEIDFGSVKNSVYHNEYFGLTVTLPSEWSVQDAEARRQIMDKGGKIFAGDDRNLKAVLKAGEMQSVNLFAACKHPIGTPVPSNPNIMCVAERVSQMPGIKRGKDYLFHAKKLLESGQMRFSFPSEMSTESVGGQDFDVMHVETSMAGMTIRQKYYATIMKGYALTFTVSFTTDEEESALQDILKSVTIK
jgi:hypothetical protein